MPQIKRRKGGMLGVLEVLASMQPDCIYWGVTRIFPGVSAQKPPGLQPGSDGNKSQDFTMKALCYFWSTAPSSLGPINPRLLRTLRTSKGTVLLCAPPHLVLITKKSAGPYHSQCYEDSTVNPTVIRAQEEAMSNCICLCF